VQIDSAQRVAQGSAKTTQATAACKNISKSKIKRSAKCAVWVASQPSISPQTANAAAHKVKKKIRHVAFWGDIKYGQRKNGAFVEIQLLGTKHWFKILVSFNYIITNSF
jgi:hypothetical protein